MIETQKVSVRLTRDSVERSPETKDGLRQTIRRNSHLLKTMKDHSADSLSLQSH